MYEVVRPSFSDEELACLTLAILAINAWNRLAIATRSEAGTYVSRHPGHHAADHGSPSPS